MSLWGAIGTIAGGIFGGAPGAAIGGSLGGAIDSNNASNKAINAQLDASREANQLQREMYNQTREDQRPFREASYGALEQIQNLLKNPSSIQSDAGYQFGLDQGTRALNSGAAARGMTYSGAQAKALTRYGQDYGQTKLDQSYNRLANIAGLGQVAANGQNNQNYAGSVGSNLLGMGNAQAAGSLYNNRNWSNATNLLASKWGQWGSDPGASMFPQWGRGGGYGSGIGGMGD